MHSELSLVDGLRASLLDNIKRLFHSLGLEVRRYNAKNSFLARRMLLIKHFGITLILDVGANEGDYAATMRQNGYRGRIVSFEPLSKTFRYLEKNTAGDPHWDVVNVALGSENIRATINVGRSSACSSLLNVLPDPVAVAPMMAQVDSEDVTVRTLDSMFDAYCTPEDTTYLKIDVQGYERHILDGATSSLKHIRGVQLEMALVPHYEGETLFVAMNQYMAELGYTLMSLEPVLAHPSTGQLLQVDGIFFRS